MTFEALFRDLQQKKFAPFYFLTGEEPYYIDRVVDYLVAHVLDEAERSFNQTLFYGKEADMSTIVNEAKRYPMMAPYNVVIVKEGQHINLKIEKVAKELLNYVLAPQPTTVFVFVYKGKKLDKRSKLYKAINSKHVFLETKKIYDDKLPGFVENEVRLRGFTISPKAAALIVESVGNDLSRLQNEIEKLKQVVEKGGAITAEVVERNIGISKDYNVFELQKALGRKDILKANVIVKYFSQDPKSNPMVFTVGLIFNFFAKVLIYHSLKDKSSNNAAKVLKINPFFLKDYQAAARTYSYKKCLRIISYIREYDMRCKGVDNGQTSHFDLMRELVFKIMH